MVHKPKHKVHSFRGLLTAASGVSEEHEVRIEQGTMGEVAWRIVKFDLIPYAFNTNHSEAVVQVYRDSLEGATPPLTIDFDDPNVLAAGLWTSNTVGQDNPFNKNIIVDNVLFIRNIYISMQCAQNSSMNWYLELEELPASAATRMQLKLGVARKLNLHQD